MTKYNKPFIVAGDWNATPEFETLKSFGRFLTPSTNTAYPTFPADKPIKCINYIAVGNARMVKFESKVIKEYSQAVIFQSLKQLRLRNNPT